ncbi:hypothetical protein ABXN37_13670 [Piscinibacter sakaiensis]|uniref:GspE/PulE/PilB domain-containing protein n=1 Tax=Piscinibacter sakaiensis TaxID=1547922 RepID=UPI003727534E
MDSGLVDAETVAHALERQTRTQPHRLIGQLLVDSEVLTASQLAALLADWLGVPTVDLRGIAPEPEALRRLPRSVALRETLLPLTVHGDALVVAMPNPWDKPLLDELRFICELRIQPAIALPGTLAPSVARAYALTNLQAVAAAAPARPSRRPPRPSRCATCTSSRPSCPPARTTRRPPPPRWSPSRTTRWCG